MSKSLQQELRSWKDLESSIRGKVILRSSIPLSKRDNDAFISAVLLQGMILSDLLISRSPTRKDRIYRWCNNLCTYDLLVVSDLLKKLTVFFRNYIPGREKFLYSDFKHLFRSEYPFIGDFMSPIKEEVESFFDSPTPTTFTIINQHLSFISRLSLRDLDLLQDSVSRYKATEERLADSTYRTSTLVVLNKIMREWTSSFTFDEFLPSHGNGSVAEINHPATIKEKYELVSSDARLDYFLRSFGTIDEFRPRSTTHQLERSCRVQCVAKSIQSWRVISMEPASLQYFQHAVYRSVDRWIRHHPILKHRIHIHDASINRKLAEHGSRYRSYATIDLSDASDSVSWQLVKAVFAGTPLLRALYCTRSDSAILPDKGVLSLKKYAPMGSALCFPVECLIFSVICEYVVRFSGIHYQGIPFVVHGDDIVILSELAPMVIEVLTELNFLVNYEKSFISKDLPFRESCGGEYYFGIDVTPVRLSRKFCDDKPGQYHPQMYPHYIDIANSLYRYNFRIARLWFIHRLFSLPQPFWPLFGENESVLNSPDFSNYRLIRKYEPKWFADKLKCGTLCDRYSDHPGDGDDDIRYFEWLRATSTRLCGPMDPEDLVDVHLSLPRSHLQSRFVSNS